MKPKLHLSLENAVLKEDYVEKVKRHSVSHLCVENFAQVVDARDIVLMVQKVDCIDKVKKDSIQHLCE